MQVIRLSHPATWNYGRSYDHTVQIRMYRSEDDICPIRSTRPSVLKDMYIICPQIFRESVLKDVHHPSSKT